MAQIDLGQVAATVTVGTTTTGTAGTSAAVTNSGTTTNAVFDFTIPQGASGCYPTVTQTAASATISPQTFNVWDEMSSLAITLGTPVSGIKNEYIFSFNSGATATALTVSPTVTWTSTLSTQANKHYEANIVYDPTNQEYYGVIVGWGWTPPST